MVEQKRQNLNLNLKFWHVKTKKVIKNNHFKKLHGVKISASNPTDLKWQLYLDFSRDAISTALALQHV
jgi:hypothetical protein